MRIAIVGSRDFPDLELVRDYMRNIDPSVTIVSGGARGVDRTATDYWSSRGLYTDTFPAEWEKYGKQAGFIRNRQMLETVDEVIAFWDMESNGTRNALAIAKTLPNIKKVTVIGPDGKMEILKEQL